MTFPAIKNINLTQRTNNTASIVLVMVCAYLFLIILRPWESISYLHGIRIEFPFAVMMISVAILAGKFRIVRSPTNKWVYGLLGLHFLLAPFAFNQAFAVDIGIFYAKLVVLYLLMLSVADNERALKLLVTVFVFSMMLYTVHSLWEFYNGRHVYRMGMVRMVGVGGYLSDPNAFGASLVLSFPFVYALLRTETRKTIRMLYYGYFGLGIYCLILTGSRSASLAFVFLLLIWLLVQKGRKKLLAVVFIFLGFGILWTYMPEDKQERIQTLWDEDVGPVGAHMSAEGRMIGWKVSWEMFKREPLTGVGAGGGNFIGYRTTNHIDEFLGIEDQHNPYSQSHTLYGQVLAEQGILGAILFTGLVFSIGKSAFVARRRVLGKENMPGFFNYLSGAIITSLLLLLFLGIGGHNFYRPLWLWLAAWSGALLNIVQGGQDVSADGR